MAGSVPCPPAASAGASSPAARVNLAPGKDYDAGQLGFPQPGLAFDGDLATSTGSIDWVVAGYLAADLGSTTSLYQTVVNFAGKPAGYWIEGSDTGADWTPILRADEPAARDERVLPAVSYRYVRFAIDTWNTPQDAWQLDKVSEIEIYARGSTDPVGEPNVIRARLPRAGWSASASYNSDAAQGAIDDQGVPPCKTWQDCYMTTNWSSGTRQVTGQWFQVDMAEPRTFDRVELNDTYDHPDNIPSSYELFVSDDAATWGAPLAQGQGAPNTRIAFATQHKRYLRVVLSADSQAFWRIADFGVFNTLPVVPLRPCSQ